MDPSRTASLVAREATAPLRPHIASTVPGSSVLPLHRHARVAVGALGAIAILLAAIRPHVAQAGYICELYLTAPNKPSGDMPGEVYWTDSRDPGAAERACLSLYGKGTWLSWYLREAPIESFPAAWRESDLLTRAFPN